MASAGLPRDARGIVFPEDVIRLRDGPALVRGLPAVGLVSRAADESEDEALSDSEEDDAPPTGHVRVAWLSKPGGGAGDNEEEEDEPEDDTLPNEALTVLDRGAFSSALHRPRAPPPARRRPRARAPPPPPPPVAHPPG